MSWRSAAAALVTASAWALGSGACSNHGNDVAIEGGTDASVPAPVPTILGVDGTSGQPCTRDIDCVPEGGPGVNKCSVSQPTRFTGVIVQRFASPVCVVGEGAGAHNCSPASSEDPATLHFCDGPDDPSAPGICVSDAMPPTAGAGTCLPKCTFGLDGSPAVGCLGSAACVPVGFAEGLDTVIPTPTGYGYCRGFCTTDADCRALGAGYECQTDIGYCTQAKTARTMPPGAACSISFDPGNPACLCATGSANSGYCTSACVVGGAPCADGWVCDNGVRRAATLAAGPFDGTSFAPVGNVKVASQNAGTGGTCYAPCMTPDAEAPMPYDAAAAVVDSSLPSDALAVDDVTDDDGTAEAGESPEVGSMAEGGEPDAGGTEPMAACPPNASCQAITVAGPDCVPSP